MTPIPADRHAPPQPDVAAALGRYLRFLGAPRDCIDDLVQDAQLAGLRAFATGDAPLPWLLTTARNALRMHLRRLGRRREVADLERLHEAWCAEVGDDGGEAKRRALAICLEGLPARSRLVLERRYRDGRSRAAIGAEAGLSDEGVKSLLARVRAALGDCIERRLRDA